MKHTPGSAGEERGWGWCVCVCRGMAERKAEREIKKCGNKYISLQSVIASSVCVCAVIL